MLNCIHVPNAEAGDFPPSGTLIVLNISDSIMGFISLKLGRTTAMLPIEKGPREMAISPVGNSERVDFDKIVGASVRQSGSKNL